MTALEEDCVTTQTRLCCAPISRPHARALARALAATVAILLAVAASASAQSGSGAAAIEGTVTDPDNRAIPTALVMIISNETGYQRTVYTDAHGRYFASAMPVGTYMIDVSATNFATTQRLDVKLTVGTTETINFSRSRSRKWRRRSRSEGARRCSTRMKPPPAARSASAPCRTSRSAAATSPSSRS